MATNGVDLMESWVVESFVACEIGETSTSLTMASVVLMGEIGWEVVFVDTVIVK